MINDDPRYYYNWMQDTHTCPACAWVGTGRQMKMGESFADGAERHCPACGHYFGYIAYPLASEGAVDPRADASDRMQAEIILRGARTARPN